MGWSSGSELAEDIWLIVKKHIPENKRKKIANKIIDLFEDMDCDTMRESESLYKDAGLVEDDNED